MLLPGACVVTFGHMLHDKRKEKKAEKVAMNAQVLPGTAQKKVIFGRQGAVVFGAMAIIFLIGLIEHYFMNCQVIIFFRYKTHKTFQTALHLYFGRVIFIIA